MLFRSVGAGVATAGDADTGTRSTRTARPPLERPQNRTAQAGTSGVPMTPSPLQDVIEKLATPVAPSADAALTQAELEEQRKNILLATNGGRRTKRGGPTRLQYQAAWAHPNWPSWPHLHRSFAQKHPRDLKMPI